MLFYQWMASSMAKDNDSLSVSVHHQIPFYDVDSYRIVWHGNYAKYFEIARCVLLEKIQFTYADMERSGYFFPVVDLKIKYIKPLHFEQKVIINAQLKEWEHRIIIYYSIYDKKTQKCLTKGHTVQVAVSMPDEVMLFEIPDTARKRIQACLQK